MWGRERPGTTRFHTMVKNLIALQHTFQSNLHSKNGMLYQLWKTSKAVPNSSMWKALKRIQVGWVNLAKVWASQCHGSLYRKQTPTSQDWRLKIRPSLEVQLQTRIKLRGRLCSKESRWCAQTRGRFMIWRASVDIRWANANCHSESLKSNWPRWFNGRETLTMCKRICASSKVSTRWCYLPCLMLLIKIIMSNKKPSMKLHSISRWRT